MMNENVKTLLLVTSSGSDCLFPFLFEFAKYWAAQGRQLLYISKSKIQSLPPSLSERGRPDSNILKLMQFMYLPKWKDVLHQLATIHIRSFQVEAIVVDDLAEYIREEKKRRKHGGQASSICAKLLFAALLASQRASKPVPLICGYYSKTSTIDRNIIKNFFHNIWETKKDMSKSDHAMFKLVKLTGSNENDIVSFTYTDTNELHNDKDRSNAQLNLTEILRQILEN